MHLLAERMAVFLFDENDKYPLEIYIYGMELIISSLIETLILISLGVLFDRLIVTFIFIICFSTIRIFTGGYHAETYIKCALVTVVSYILVLLSCELLLKYCFDYLLFIGIFVFILSFILIRKFAPIENKNKLLENKQRLKQISLLCLILEFVLFVTGLFANFSQALVIVTTVLSVDVLMLVEVIRKGGGKNEKHSQDCNKENMC